ncbi:CGNR zinc finger domain-containing protein [Jatrophihabitans sp. YIM 134969]
MTGDDATRSTARLGLDAAPAGLCVVQDLLNTAAMTMAPVPDLLADRQSAQAWLDASLRTWAEHTGATTPDITVGPRDLAALRQLRDSLRSSLTREGNADRTHPVDVQISVADGHVRHAPRGDGARAVASLVHLETLLASHTGTLRRLKTCQNPACGAAFYDHSRNATRVWHDMKTCGNTMNLRASRARRREQTTDSTGS